MHCVCVCVCVSVCVLDWSVDQAGGDERPPTTLGKDPVYLPRYIFNSFFSSLIYLLYWFSYMCKLDANTCYSWLCYLASSCQVLAGAEIGGLEGSHLGLAAYPLIARTLGLGQVYFGALLWMTLVTLIDPSLPPAFLYETFFLSS
jgi:hypothetical protein